MIFFNQGMRFLSFFAVDNEAWEKFMSKKEKQI